MIYAIFNAQGRIIQAVNDSTILSLPENAKELTDEQWSNRFNLLLVDDQLTDSPLEPEAATPEEIVSKLTVEIQKRLDGFANTRGYDNVNSASKYKDISDEEITALPVEVQADVTKFRREARYLALKTAETWARCYLILAQFNADGQVPAEEAILGQLPSLDWPD